MFIWGILKATLYLFIEMAPYLMLGFLFVGILNLFITKDLIAKHIGDNSFKSVFKAALFGIPLPLCSCGVIPTSVYMVKNGASKPSVVSFLTATPQTGIDSIFATYGMMGPVIAVFRPIAALLMGIINGILTRLGNIRDTELQSDNRISTDSYNYNQNPQKDIKYYFQKFFVYPFVEFLDDISSQFIVGLFIAGLITFLIPENFFSKSMISNGLLGMLVLLLISIPMYVCATASIPIAVSLMLKGFSPGVAFVFLAAGPATNAASLSVISKVLGKKITTYFVVLIAVMSIVFGLLLDWIFSFLNIDPLSQIATVEVHNMNHFGIFQSIVSGILFILLIMSMYRKFIQPRFRKELVVKNNNKKINIEGMTCNHCVMNVTKTIEAIPGVNSVEVSLAEHAAFVEGEFDVDKLQKDVEAIGYKVRYE